ncbi:SNF2 family N-terminal domain-containing protein [Lasiosphaeria miniovina]|uniref:SNF2 family N-terminal domain-containing protein n=1 Tax=Lasiosphaeria miniovina TaxID=1954250 RepID=A0AA40DHK9_9PEZI|nr:SNF2 family N-terminal domain-containing protein [Lasiosphaeria miniovina]KAK0703849.1 SNF2 family N-terminal domain-containing protein [Lasiosphaeria miniovina]
MANAGSQEPPSKRRRFFSDADEEIHTSLLVPLSFSSPTVPRARFFENAVDRHDQPGRAIAASSPSALPVARAPLSEQDVASSLNRLASPQTAVSALSESASTSTPFDQTTFESFVGEKIGADVLEILVETCGNDIERAVNMYLDGTWKIKRKFPTLPTPNRLSASIAVSRQQGNLTIRPHDSFRPVPESRYIGAFGVEGWATRSGHNLLKHGDVIKIERQKIQPPKAPATKGQAKLGGAQSTPRMSSAARRVDVIVRFTDATGQELGRLAKDTANWVSTLMDQRICKFEGTCVYAPERLRTNDTVFLQLKVSLLRSAFFGRKLQTADNRTTGLFQETETSEEKELRLRQVALVRLFQEIGLVPSRGNAAAAKDQRQGLLTAAELAENKAREKTKSSEKDNPESSPHEDEDEDGEELEQDQLDSLYKKAQSFDFNTPEAEPAETFAMTLRRYQKQSLHWMLAKEKDERNEDRELSMHPLWEEYAWPTKDYNDKELSQVAHHPTFYVNPYSGDLSLDFPRQEQHCLGGVLADEMGLGKTIQMLSLVHSHRSQAAIRAKESSSSVGSVNNLPRLPSVSSSVGVSDAPCTTLVVAPMSLLAQWQSETENASKEGTLKSMVYYGSDKNADLLTSCCEANAANAPDLIITSYGTVLSEFSQIASKNRDRGGSRGIFALNFFRVILDEAHSIKNRQSKTARACYEIAAKHRWVLTGTPIVNKLEDLFSLVRFLRVEPWNNFSFWRTFITVPFESKDFMRALDVVQTVLEPLVMRRTKDMKTPDGQPLVALPPKRIEIVNIELSETERAVYDYIFTRAKRTFNANVEAGTVMKAFTSIFAQILRLRQSCCHPILVRNQEVVADEEVANAAADAAAGFADDMDLSSLIERFTATTDDIADSNAFGAHVLGQIRDEAVNECPICAEEPMIDQTVTGCWHSACKNCLLHYIKHETDHHNVPRCFNCREVINSRDLFQVVRHDDDDDDKHRGCLGKEIRISLQRLGTSDSSAKVVSLIERLRDLRRESPTMKSVVFSQFTSFLSLIEPALARAKMHFLRLDGSMAQKARAAVLNEFRESKKFTILLISLKAGGVGLNLTSAKRVFMMDPWWSFAIEAQAIDRVHRMGQEDEVKVYRFIVKDSVEERMLKIQDRKKFIATSLGMMSDEEKKLQRIEDIRDLLS